MRARIRKVIDIDKPINLRRLSPFEKIVVSVRKQASISLFSNAQEKKARELHKKRIEREDELKSYLLSQIRNELVNSKEVSKYGKTSKEIVFAIEAKYKDLIFDEVDSFGNVINKGILSTDDFSQYEIIRIEENKDIRRSFTEMPYLFRCRRRVI